MSTIWVTGAGGLIGSHLVRVARSVFPESKTIALARSQLDLTDFAAVEREYHQERPELVFHCAALSRSPDCQALPALARKLNVEVTAILAQLAADSRLFFFSSDLVFDGSRGHYREQDPPNPLSVYAETKVEAEQLVLSNPRHTVIRTSLNGGPSPTGDRGFDEQMCQAWQSGKVLRLFTDEFRCPIRAQVTAKAVCELARERASGLFHVAGAERVSRWEIGFLMARGRPEREALIEPASLREYHGAPRSPDTSLCCDKAQALLSFKLPGCRDWLGTSSM